MMARIAPVSWQIGRPVVLEREALLRMIPSVSSAMEPLPSARHASCSAWIISYGRMVHVRRMSSCMLVLSRLVSMVTSYTIRKKVFSKGMGTTPFCLAINWMRAYRVLYGRVEGGDAMMSRS